MRTLLLIILALLASTAHAWGTQGHQVIASLAQAQLTTTAKAEIDKQLAVLGSDAPADKRLTAFVGRRSELACTVLMPERRAHATAAYLTSQLPSARQLPPPAWRLTNFVSGMNLKDLEAAKTTLAQAVAMAESQSKGKAVKVQVEHERGGVQFDVFMRVGDSTKKMKIDAASGKAI